MSTEHKKHTSGLIIYDHEVKLETGEVILIVSPEYSIYNGEDILYHHSFKGLVIYSNVISVHRFINKNVINILKDRINEIVEQISRYKICEKAIPIEWIVEYNSIIERIKNNKK